MEIKNQPIPGPNGRRGPLPERDGGIDLTRPNREGIEKVVADLESERALDLGSRRSADIVPTAVHSRQESDRIDLSEQARALAQTPDADGDVQTAQRARIAALRADYLEGRVNTPERIEHSAGKLLGGP